MTEGLSQREMIEQIYLKLEKLDEKFDTHLLESAGARQRLASLEKSHYSLRHDYEGRDGSNGFKGKTRVALTEIKTQIKVGVAVLGLLVPLLTGLLLRYLG